MFDQGKQRKIGFRARLARIIGKGRTGIGTEYIFRLVYSQLEIGVWRIL